MYIYIIETLIYIIIYKIMEVNKKMSKVISISLDEEYNKRFEKIAKAEYSDKSKLLRKWIDQNYKEEYDLVESE